VHQIHFRPDPTGGAYSAPPDPLASLRGPASNGRGRGRRASERKGRGKGEEGKGGPPPSQIPGSAPVFCAFGIYPPVAYKCSAISGVVFGDHA